MHQKQIALVLAFAAYLAAPATAQFVTGPIEPATPALPHTAVYTTTVAQRNHPNPPQPTATVIVTLIVPRDVARPTNSSSSSSKTLVTGTVISHFSEGNSDGGAPSTWSETTQLVWSTISEEDQFPPVILEESYFAKSTLSASYTDYKHWSAGLYGAWSIVHYNFYSTIRETVVERVGPAYPATIVRTGYTDVKVALTLEFENGPTQTQPDRETSTEVRTTTLVQVTARPVG